MNNGSEALIGFIAAHGDTFELLQFTEEILDQMPPFVHLAIDCDGDCAARVLRDDDLGAALVEVGDDGVAVESLVGDQRSERDPLDQRRDANRVEALTGQQDEVDEIAERIGEREYLGRHAALGAAYGLTLRPPFAPCP